MREVKLYKNYFQDFYDRQSQKVKEKIIWTFRLLKELVIIPETYFKHLEGTNGLYEIRVQSGNNIFRIFSFFDKNNVIIIGNAFQRNKQNSFK
ncbi:MAG: type II toxin-antitoxin system RelE/ParE family toxin [Ignavibacteria bacterium]|nr:type II toxin-antitoxin system RelE/ParE family toxin [Ignavibacteria bacterium]